MENTGVWVLENDEGTAGTREYLFLFVSKENAVEFAAKLKREHKQEWEPRKLEGLGHVPVGGPA